MSQSIIVQQNCYRHKSNSTLICDAAMTASGIPGEVAQVETMDAVIAGVRRFHQSGRTDSSI